MAVNDFTGLWAPGGTGELGNTDYGLVDSARNFNVITVGRENNNSVAPFSQLTVRSH